MDGTIYQYTIKLMLPYIIYSDCSITHAIYGGGRCILDHVCHHRRSPASVILFIYTYWSTGNTLYAILLIPWRWLFSIKENGMEYIYTLLLVFHKSRAVIFQNFIFVAHTRFNPIDYFSKKIELHI